MPRGRPVDPETRARIVEALESRPDVGRNTLAREFEVAAATVTAIAREVGHEFDRSSTALAVRARQVDLSALRGELAQAALLRAWEALEAMDAPATMVHFETGFHHDVLDVTDGQPRVLSKYEPGEFREHVLDAPTFSDQRNLATIFGIMTQRAADLTRADTGAGAEAGAGLLDGLSTALHVAAEHLRNDSSTDPTIVPDVGD